MKRTLTIVGLTIMMAAASNASTAQTVAQKESIEEAQPQTVD